MKIYMLFSRMDTSTRNSMQNINTHTIFNVLQLKIFHRLFQNGTLLASWKQSFFPVLSRYLHGLHYRFDQIDLSQLYISDFSRIAPMLSRNSFVRSQTISLRGLNKGTILRYVCHRSQSVSLLGEPASRWRRREVIRRFTGSASKTSSVRCVY